MPKKNLPRQRSVGVQSSESRQSVIETGPLTARLCKKTGFRNLLRNSVTVATDIVDEGHENVYLPGGNTSRGVQAALDDGPGVVRYPYGGSLEFRSTRGSTTETVRLVEKGLGTANPGPSTMASTGVSTFSMFSQVNEVFRRPHEGSLAVVYNYDKPLTKSRSSNLHFYGSQGSRRYSNETVLLIEDYQSYDYTNTAGRQENAGRRRRLSSVCCMKRKRQPLDPLTRPLPIQDRGPQEISEDDEYFVCRICHEGEDVEPLIQPCLCKGSIGCVHARCLKTWLEQSNTSRCELCNYPYAIKQSKKYSKCVSLRVYFRTVVEKRTLVYDVISFVVITPLTLVGVVMCIQASVTPSSSYSGSNTQMGNITKAGMIMLGGTILVAYAVWFYTLIAFHYKNWKKWYDTSYDVEVIPVRMTSSERILATQRLNEELDRRQLSRETGSTVVTLIQPPRSANLSLNLPRRMSVAEISRS